MKKHLLFFLLVLPALFKAQITFPAPGAQWHYAKSVFAGPQIYNEPVTISVDTVILGKPCKGSTGLREYNYCANMAPSYFYTSNDSVYFYNARTLGQWELLYNFNAVAGDSWHFYLDLFGNLDTVSISVDSVRSTVINTFSLKTLYVTYHHNMSFGMNNYYEVYRSVIYDRIGDIGYILNYEPDINGVCDDGGERFLCYQDSAFAVYQHDSLPCNYTNVGIAELGSEIVGVYPNPVTDILYVESSASGQPEFYLEDLFGKKVGMGKVGLQTTSFPDGIYFVRIKTAEGPLSRKIVIQH